MLDGSCGRNSRVDICLARDETYRRRGDSHERIGRILWRVVGIRLDERSLYDAYTDIKRRKGESRTYFLDKLRERLNLRMQRDDEKERERRC